MNETTPDPSNPALLRDLTSLTHELARVAQSLTHVLHSLERRAVAADHRLPPPPEQGQLQGDGTGEGEAQVKLAGVVAVSRA